MNNKFFSLPDEKQQAIINAGCKGFYKFGYRKASMSEIASEAGISKSLLFHYFKNKSEFYFYLFDSAMQLTMEIAKEEITVSETDFFEIFIESARIKSRLLSQYAYLSRFMMQAYYEEDEAVATQLASKANLLTSNNIESILKRIDKSKFKENVDVEQLVKIVIWCGEGYMKEKYYNTQLDINIVKAGYVELLDFFRQNCYKEQYQNRIFKND